MSACCHLCGSTEIRADSPKGSPTCADCWPITDHVVSMQTGADGSSRAVCECGWRSEVTGAKRHMLQQVKIRMHWRDVIRRAIAAYDAEFGDGSAKRELTIGAGVLVLVAVNLLGVALVFGGGHYG